MAETTDNQTAPLLQTPLHDDHVARGARMVPFAGYHMPVQFAGVKGEHEWTRQHAGLFDVSHMGPCFLFLKEGLGQPGAHQRIAALIERLVPSDIAALKPGQGRLSVLLNETGGIMDDLIITRMPDPALDGMLYIVVNGAVKHQDWALIERELGEEAALQRADNRMLVALQGPEAEAVLAPLFPEGAGLSFMRCAYVERGGEKYMVSRCGYTGEDGFELLLPDNAAGHGIVQALLADERVRPIGLGARDSLRLEAGLPLYGHDMSPETSPIEAGLIFGINKRRRTEGGFPGADRIIREINEGTSRKWVGLKLDGRLPAREGAEVFSGNDLIGTVTSGGFSPTLGAPIAMAYVASSHAAPGTALDIEVRGKRLSATVTPTPFIPHRYYRGS